MSASNILIVHNDPSFILDVTQIVEEIGCQAIALSDARHFQGAYATNQPQLIIYECFSEYCDGIELTQWLIDQNNKARVVLTASKMLEVAEVAVTIAEAANLFPLSILRCPASRDEIMFSLKVREPD